MEFRHVYRALTAQYTPNSALKASFANISPENLANLPKLEPGLPERYGERGACVYNRESGNKALAEGPTARFSGKIKHLHSYHSVIGSIPWGHSGPLCHALSSLSSWTSPPAL